MQKKALEKGHESDVLLMSFRQLGFTIGFGFGTWCLLIGYENRRKKVRAPHHVIHLHSTTDHYRSLNTVGENYFKNVSFSNISTLFAHIPSKYTISKN